MGSYRHSKLPKGRPKPRSKHTAASLPARTCLFLLCLLLLLLPPSERCRRHHLQRRLHCSSVPWAVHDKVRHAVPSAPLLP